GWAGEAGEASRAGRILLPTRPSSLTGPTRPDASEHVAHPQLHLPRGVGDDRLTELRGIAVPNHVVEVDVIQGVVDLPEESRGSLALQLDDVLEPQVEQRLVRAGNTVPDGDAIGVHR